MHELQPIWEVFQTNHFFQSYFHDHQENMPLLQNFFGHHQLPMNNFSCM